MIDANEWMQLPLENEIFETLCGPKIGSGMSRSVFECNLDSSVVIKIEDVTKGKYYQNLFEWQTWLEVRETPYAHWFAPCVSISNFGGVLIQKKTRKPRSKNAYPKKMPTFMGDFKYTNYGMYKGKLCAHDYGRNLLMQHGLSSKKKVVEWWNDLDSEYVS